MTLPAFDYAAPTTMDEALALRRAHGDDALLMAGGLILVILMRERMARPQLVVSLSDIAPLHGISTNGVLRLGAMTTHTGVAKSSMVRGFAPLLALACGHIGSPAIRNSATLGGNLSHADPASDAAPALLALDAVAVIAGPQGERRVPFDQFFNCVFDTAIGEDEILAAVEVPPAAPDTTTRFCKFTNTSAEAYSTVTAAIALTRDSAGRVSQARIGLGSVAPTPIRALAAEDMLRGQMLSHELIAEADEAAQSATDPATSAQATAEYRREMTGVWVRRLLEQMQTEAS
jgi:carbon-monoxide dehydrogenase medium subunit